MIQLKNIYSIILIWQEENIFVRLMFIRQLQRMKIKITEKFKLLFLTLPDGKPLSVVGKKRGKSSMGRVTGPDFLEEVLRKTKIQK